MPQFISQSRPYARSCLSVATAAKAQTQWAAALDALAGVAAAPEFARLPGLPGVRADKLAGLVLATAAELAPLPEGIANLVGLLVENHRLPLLPDIAASFRRLWHEQSERVSVAVETAFELSEDEREQLRAALQRRLGAEPEINISVCPELGAGAVVRIGDDVIDASLRSRLHSFAQSLAYG